MISRLGDHRVVGERRRRIRDWFMRRRLENPRFMRRRRYMGDDNIMLGKCIRYRRWFRVGYGSCCWTGLRGMGWCMREGGRGSIRWMKGFGLY